MFKPLPYRGPLAAWQAWQGLAAMTKTAQPSSSLLKPFHISKMLIFSSLSRVGCERATGGTPPSPLA
jgi:hypothetical protein